MEWIDQLNKAMEYVETHLEEEIRYEELAKIACCSTFHFQRMFTYISGAPLGEYLRRRRMTKAAQELQQGDGKIVDIALKYGYQSPTAFNRAFQSVHDVAPSEAKKEGVILKSHQPISFRITVSGGEELSYKIEKKDAFRIVGIAAPLEKEIEKNFDTVPMLWGRAAAEGILPKLAAMMDSQPKGVLGVSACFGEDWRYYMAVASAQPLPEGMEEYHVPAGTWAIFQGKGAMPDSLQDLERRAVLEWLPSSGYEYADLPDIEVYLHPDPADAVFEVWLPVVKK